MTRSALRLARLGLYSASLLSSLLWALPARARTDAPPPAGAAATTAPTLGGVRIAGRDGVQILDPAGTVVGTLAIPTAGSVHDALRVGSTLYVACGTEGVIAFDLADPRAPRMVSRFGAGRNAVRLTLSGSQLLVIVAEYGVLAYSLADAQHPVASALGDGTQPGAAIDAAAAPPVVAAQVPPAPTQTAPAVGAVPPARSPARVTTVRAGWVALSSEQPIEIGARFVIRSQRLTRTTDPTTGRTERAPSNEPTGMVVVERVGTPQPTQPGGAPVYVGSGRILRGTQARVGDLAEPTTDPARDSIFVPRLWYGMTRFYGHLRPLLNVAPIGFGMMNDFRLEHYFGVPIKLGMSVAPLAFLSTNPVGVLSEVRLHAAFSSSYFEVSFDPGGILNRLGGMGFSFGWSFRLGSIDGLNLIFRNSYLLQRSNSSDSRFDFYAAGGEINIPLARRFTLHLVSEGSRAYVWGTLGLKYWLRGSGGPGTLILDSGIGGFYFNDRCGAISNSSDACSGFSIGRSEGGGPSASLGLDARF